MALIPLLSKRVSPREERVKCENRCDGVRPGILPELRPDTNQSFYMKNFPKIHSKISGMVI
jgi:hypothetical protein